MENNKLTKIHNNEDSAGDSDEDVGEEIMEESENGVDVKSSPLLGKNRNQANNVELSRSSSSVSLISSSQADDAIRSNCQPEEVAKSDESEVPLEEVEKVIKRNLPSMNVPEKIILCLDISQDPDFNPFKLGDGSKHTPLSMAKRVAEIFIKSKNIINPKHEFALIIMESDTILWLRDFTSEPCDIISVIEDINEAPQSDTFDLTCLFDVIKSHVKLPVVDDPILVPPPYVVRTILLYSRSYCLPEFKLGRDTFEYLLSSQYFTLDILYIHEEPSEKNKCEEIFKVLDALDEKGLSYIFDVPRNATKLHHDMAKLLAHPLQRPLQKFARYKLELPQESQ
ncbi:hypothetical protein R5R35_004809 [Gryllus longicercus]|uniref:BRISC and BRCA1-A complex member 1 n=1 Tax=Gryllus longicercus TaxID=2509291 RepID=A0AAN9VTI6_9ORTH